MTTDARRFAILGALLGLGAPLGLLALRRVHPRTRALPLLDEVRAQPLTYTYMTVATMTAFGVFGALLGRRDDRIASTRRELDRLREEFVAVVAHDLRGPIQTVSLQSERLLGQVVAGAASVPVAGLERIRRATEGLARMVDDLLDASRIEAARLTVYVQDLCIADGVASVVDCMRPLLTGHPIELTSDPSAWARVDPQRFDQILTNLLENAAKYSPEGSPIAVRVARDGEEVLVSVEDRGMGIERDELPRLFDRFYQTQRAREKKSGLGLGLYIAKGLVEAQRGRIRVESEPGRGSTFFVWFPCASRLPPSAP